MRATIRRSIGAVAVVAAVVLSVPGVAQAGLATVPLSLAATAGNAQVGLTWTAPTSNGGENVTDYIVEYSPNAGTT